jgi:hypothetical protein
MTEDPYVLPAVINAEREYLTVCRRGAPTGTVTKTQLMLAFKLTRTVGTERASCGSDIKCADIHGIWERLVGLVGLVVLLALVVSN